MIISSADSTRDARERIEAGQKGGYKPLKTRYQHFNDIMHGGLPRQKIVTIGGLSSFGKSYTLRNIEEDIFDENLNPGLYGTVVLCKIDFEMSKDEAILSRVQQRTGRNFEDILYSEPDEEITEAFNAIYEELSSPNIFETFQTYKPDVFYKTAKAFCVEHSDKRQIVLTIDNSNLIDSEGSDESSALAELQTILIRLKRETPNLTIIQLAQLNRELKKRNTDPKYMFPMTSDFYNSSKIEHASDIQIVVHIPYLLGIEEYGAFSMDKYSYLNEKYILDKGKYGMFKTKGLVFWHYLKVRAKNDLQNFQDVHVEVAFKEEEPEKSSARDTSQLF
jgi:replicative DNA helicase